MQRVLRWIGIILLILVTLVLLGVTVVYYIGSSKLDRTYEATGMVEDVPGDSASIAEGSRLADIYGCRSCHGDNLAGTVMIDAPPFFVVAPNLTPGAGGTADYSVIDWDRAIRFGIKRNGRAVLPVMPSKSYHKLTDGQVRDLIAFLKSMAPVDHNLPASELRPLGTVLAGAGAIDIAAAVSALPRGEDAPPVGRTEQYGRYLASITCVVCHGADLRGMEPHGPDEPAGPDLAPAGAWSLEMFVAAMREGVAPGGRKLAEAMPSKYFRHMTDDELVALHIFLKTLAEKSVD